MSYGTSGTFGTASGPRNRGLDRLRKLREIPSPSRLLPGPWPACPGCSRASGWNASAADPAVRCPCGTPRPEEEPDPRCVRCEAPLAGPDDLLCPLCYARKRPGTPTTLAETPSGTAGPVGIEPGDATTPLLGPAAPTDGVLVVPPPAPEAQADLFGGTA